MGRGSPEQLNMLEGDFRGLSLQLQLTIYQQLANSQDVWDPLQIKCADYAG